MAIKGLSIPICGEYNNNNGAVTYSNPLVVNKAVEYSVAWTVGDNNPLYADNGIAENDKGTFQSGELTLTTADLPQELSLKILGTIQITETVGEKEVTVQIFDDKRNSPYLGFGLIELHQESDVDQYRAIFLNKIFFNLPENAATTKGETIDWQTSQITAAIMRSDEVSANRVHPWMEDAWFESEADALGWLKYKCGKTASTQNLRKAAEK